MTHRQTRQFCKLDDECQNLLKAAMTELGLSARAHDKVLRVARTIADLDQQRADPPDAPQRGDQLPDAGSAFVDVGDEAMNALIKSKAPDPFSASKEKTMIRSIIAAIMLALIAVHVAAGEEDLATQIRALQKERLETLTRLVKIYTLQYKAGYVSGEVFADAETALVNAQLDAALVNVQLDAASKLPDAVITIVENADARRSTPKRRLFIKDSVFFVETEYRFSIVVVGLLACGAQVVAGRKERG